MIQKVGDVWFRVEGAYIDDGSDTFQGMELDWQEWKIVKLTPCGAWFRLESMPWKKQKFALSRGARWISPTKQEAIKMLISRKKKQLYILDHQIDCAKETLELAMAANIELEFQEKVKKII